jgi:MFS family permease
VAEPTGGRVTGGFSRLLAAASVSFLGDGITLVALPLVSVGLTSNPALVSATRAASALPWLLFGLIGGSVADRVDRRRLMIRVDIIRSAALGALVVSLLSDHSSIYVVWAAAFALGTGETLFDPAASAAVPMLVEPDRLTWANGRLFTGESVAKELVGPAVGGVLFGIATWAPFAFDAVSFLVSALLIAGLVLPTVPAVVAPDGSAAPARRIRTDIAEGWRYLIGVPLLRDLSIIITALNFAAAALEATVVFYALDALDLSEAGFGLLLAFAAIGGLIGALTADRVEARLGSGTTLMLGTGLAGVAMSLAAFSDHPIPAAMALALVFAGNAWALVVWFALRQSLPPNAMVGRVVSITRTAMLGVMPAGAIVGGLLVHRYGPRACVWLYAGTALIGSLAVSARANDRRVERARADRAVPGARPEAVVLEREAVEDEPW